MMLNPPTLIEHNNDFVVNGTILSCSPPGSSNRFFDKKYSKLSRKRPRHEVVGKMASRIHVLHAVNRHFSSTLTSTKSSSLLLFLLEH